MMQKAQPYEVERWAMAQTLGPRKHAHKLLLMALAIYADRDGYCYPAQSRLGQDCELSRQTVNEHLGWLEAAGYIARRARHRDDGSQTSNEYLVLFRDAMTWPDGEPVGTGEGSLVSEVEADPGHQVSQTADRPCRDSTTADVASPRRLEEIVEDSSEETSERTTDALASGAPGDDDGELWGLRDYIAGLGERGILKPVWAAQDYAKPDWQAVWRDYVRDNGKEQVAIDLALLFDVIDDLARPEIVREYRNGQQDWAAMLAGRRSVQVFTENLDVLRATVERFPLSEKAGARS